MKKKIFMLTLLFVSVVIFAQTGEAPVETKQNVVELIKVLLLPGILGQVLILFSDAGKWIKSGEFNWSIFFTTKLKPFLLINVISILIIVLYTFVPYFTLVFNAFTGYELSALTSLSVYGAATAILDGFLKKLV